MGWTAYHWGLAAMMMVTGSINTIVTRAADKVMVKEHGERIPFTHPFVQAIAMFLGEACCLLVYRIQLCTSKTENKPKQLVGKKKFNPFILMLPAACDMCATSTMYIGLGLTHASDFQMLRGAVVIFTGLASKCFLGRKLHFHHWLGMLLVTAGTAIVGTDSLVCKTASSGAKDPILGDMVIEEKFIGGYNLPAMQVVGLEGVFGFCMLTTVVVIMYFIPQPDVFKPLFDLRGSQYDPYGNATLADCPHHGVTSDGDLKCYGGGNHFEDGISALSSIVSYPALTLYTLGTVVSIAFFNFSGVSITKHMSAAARMVLDSLRTIVIWAFSLGVKWQTFCWVELIGFAFLLAGSVVFNALAPIPCYTYPDDTKKPSTTEEPLLSDFEADSVSTATPTIKVMDNLLTPSMGRNTQLHQR